MWLMGLYWPSSWYRKGSILSEWGAVAGDLPSKIHIQAGSRRLGLQYFNVNVKKPLNWWICFNFTKLLSSSTLKRFGSWGCASSLPAFRILCADCAEETITKTKLVTHRAALRQKSWRCCIACADFSPAFISLQCMGWHFIFLICSSFQLVFKPHISPRRYFSTKFNKSTQQFHNSYL